MRITHLVHVLVFELAMTVVVPAQERKIKKANLPAAVQKTVTSQSHGATVRGFSEERENGQTYYELELVANGHSKDVRMDASGEIVEVEEAVTLDSLPTSVQVGLQTLSGRGQILKVESLTKHGALVAYEAQVRTDGTRSEVKVDADGRPLVRDE